MVVYGIAENKCLEEVLVKDDFIIINKVIHNVPICAQDSVVITASDLGVDSVTDLMLISHMVKTSDWRFPYTHGGGSLNDGNAILIDDEYNNIRLYYENHGSMESTMTIRLVFMKVS